MRQPPGGPASSAQSAALEPVGSCDDTLALLSEPLQPVDSHNELMSRRECLLCVCVSVTAQICYRGLGQTAPGATFGGVWGGGGVGGATSPSSTIAWHCGRGQQAPRAPLPRQIPPC